MDGAFFVTWYLDQKQRWRLRCDPRTPSGSPTPDWVIPTEQLELSRDLDIVDSQLARFSDERDNFDHKLYARSLLAAAVTGLDGSNLPLEDRDSSKAKPIAAGPVLIPVTRDCIEAMRNDFLMTFEQRVKDEELSLLAIRVIAFSTIPWLLLLVPGLSGWWLAVPLLLAGLGAFANGLGSKRRGALHTARGMQRQVAAAPRLMRKEAAGAYVGAPELLELLRTAGWIKPTVGKNRMTLFDQKKLDECIGRLNDGEFPEAA